MSVLRNHFTGSIGFLRNYTHVQILASYQICGTKYLKRFDSNVAYNGMFLLLNSGCIVFVTLPICAI